MIDSFPYRLNINRLNRALQQDFNMCMCNEVRFIYSSNTTAPCEPRFVKSASS